jgi:23S rRNA (guanosine2251-2'-O)-methyltransferase
MGNFGSIIRNCRAFGFTGIIISKKRSVTLNRKVSKISAGALEGVSIFRVPNLAMTIKKLKSAGFWIYGTTLEKDTKVQGLGETDFVFPMALVMGSEDRGMSRIVAENCDVLVSIDLTGRMQSLNVSVASGIILHHIQEKYREEKN